MSTSCLVGAVGIERTIEEIRLVPPMRCGHPCPLIGSNGTSVNSIRLRSTRNGCRSQNDN